MDGTFAASATVNPVFLIGLAMQRAKWIYFLYGPRHNHGTGSKLDGLRAARGQFDPDSDPTSAVNLAPMRAR
jgi:hypothetical protein